MRSLSKRKTFVEPGTVFSAVIQSWLQWSVPTETHASEGVFFLHKLQPGKNRYEVVVLPLIAEAPVALALFQACLSWPHVEQLLALCASAGITNTKGNHSSQQKVEFQNLFFVQLHIWQQNFWGALLPVIEGSLNIPFWR